MLVFLVSGKAQSGKDTFYSFVSEYGRKNGLKVARIAFADAVKDIAYQLGWDGKKDDRGRKLLQTLGTEVGRAYNPSIWVDKGIEKLRKEHEAGTDIVCFTDCRFPNEIDSIKRLDWIVGDVVSVRIERNSAGAGVNNGHDSECALDNYEFDCVILNDGEMVDFKGAIESMLKKNNKIIQKNILKPFTS